MAIICILSDTLQKLVAVKGWQTSSGCGEIHSGHVMHRTEQSDLPVHSSVGLHALKQLLGVVKNLQRNIPCYCYDNNGNNIQ